MSTPTPIALVLEDEREIRHFVRTSLEVEGWQVVEAGTIKQGLVEAGTRRPDLIIADLGLPDGDGVDFIREVRTWSGVPIIVLSARTHESEKVAALDAGADDYITKPFGVAELLARTRANLRRVRLRVEGQRERELVALPRRTAWSGSRRPPHPAPPPCLSPGRGPKAR